MATQNDFLIVANSATNIESQTTYAGDAVVTNGVTSGTALSSLVNKIFRQATSGMALLAAFMVGQSQPAVDSGSASSLLTNFTAALTSFVGSLFTSSITGPGYVRFPVIGLIIQWGFGTTSAGGGIVFTLPIAFPTASFAVAGNGNSSSVTPAIITFQNSNTTVTAFASNGSGSGVSIGVWYIVIGH